MQQSDCACNYLALCEGVAPGTPTAQDLQATTQAFVRSFGLLVTRQTPCGQPISPSIAHALIVLLEREGAGLVTYQHELADALALDRSSVARLCSRLEADARVKQEPAPDDARTRGVRLTARGRRLAENVRTASLRRFTRILDAIPGPERGAVVSALELLTAAVRKLEEE